MEGHFLEYNGIKQNIPKDLNSSAFVGARVGMAKSDKLAVVINCGDSTAAAFTLSLQQHDAASAGNSKALNIGNAYFYKSGAETSFTKVELTTSVATLDLASIFASAEGIVVLEVFGEDLDVNNGYAYVSANIADTTAAKIVSVEYILHDMREKPAYKVVL